MCSMSNTRLEADAQSGAPLSRNVRPNQLSEDKAVTHIRMLATDIAARTLTMICFALLTPAVASAESVAATLNRWGLIGTTAKNCAKPGTPGKDWRTSV